MRRAAILLASLSLSWGLAVELKAQPPRRFGERIPRGSERALEARLEIALGRVWIAPGSGQEVFSGDVLLEHLSLQPRVQYRLVDGVGKLWVGLEDERGREGIHLGLRDLLRPAKATWRLSLPRGLPTDLELSLAAAQANLELGGLAIKNLQIESGASALVLRFSEPNPMECDLVSLRLGVSDLKGHALGNARARRYRVEVGMGSLELDLSGALPEEVELRIQAGMGSLTLQLPRDRRVELRTSPHFLQRLHLPPGFVQQGSIWIHAPERARGMLRLEIEASLGAITLRWAEP
ncbi:MAG: hypothetical protein N2561_03330 [Bacteroidetes bacterium]|nr:hypothetical protein [Rhodothermia bacterium]MCS7155692.1 hypothetical protein [Bacteroidota bacterium]MCX7906551.1 hypothetical protein [Bacteroidota bacterium]MDW8137168.1 hypothetical protein [Bacteroidota bacterium]MDW8284962.1 hypothetical protein [Bacteroidota bacterium]